MIRFKDISVYIGDKAIIDSISFETYPGEVTIIVGRNGSGKTMLLNAISGLAMVGLNAKVNGVIDIDGLEIDLKSGNLAKIIRYITYISFYPDLQMIFPQVYDEITHLSRRNTLNDLVEQIKIDSYLSKGIDELSTGEKKRLALMIYLSVSGKIILMDEPSSDLDVWGIEALIDLITYMKRKGLALIITTNDPYLALGLADRIIVIDNGEVKDICSGNRDEIINCYLRSSEKYGLRSIKPIEIKENNQVRGEEIVKISKLHYLIRGNNILKNIDLEMYRGSVECIIGANGSGKTTLGKIIAKLIKPYRGVVEVLSNKEPVYIPQEYHLSLWGMSVADIMKKYRDRGIDALKYYGVKDLIHRHPLTLSGGEKLKVALARALATESDLQILDEPTNILDSDGLYALKKHLDHIIKNDGTPILITHDIETIVSVCNNIYLLDKGELVFQGSPIKMLKWIYRSIKLKKRYRGLYIDSFIDLYIRNQNLVKS